jgi:hypothetical protein
MEKFTVLSRQLHGGNKQNCGRPTESKRANVGNSALADFLVYTSNFNLSEAYVT